MLGREELVPQWIGLLQGRARIGLGDVVGMGARRLPCARDEFRLAEHGAYLVDDGRLDLARGHANHRARCGTVLGHRLARLAAEESVALTGVGGWEAAPSGPNGTLFGKTGDSGCPASLGAESCPGVQRGRHLAGSRAIAANATRQSSSWGILLGTRLACIANWLVQRAYFERVVDQEGEFSNSLFEVLQDWNVQLKAHERDLPGLRP